MRTCSEPALNMRITDLCCDLAAGEDRTAIEAHLLVCDECWAEFQRVSEAVHILRNEKSLVEPVMAADLIQLAGLGAQVRRRLGGHAGLIATVSGGYGAMMALALLVEVAYQWETYGTWALTAAVGLAVASTLVSLLSFEVARRRLLGHRRNSLRIAPVMLVGWTAFAAVALAPLLSLDPIVLARFQTMTGQLGWIKNTVQALQIPLLSIVPIHFVLALQNELRSDHVDRVLRLLTNDRMRVTPRGTLFVRPVIAGLIYAAFATWWILGTAHLLENLQPGPQLSLFMSLGIARTAVLLIVLLAVFIWYTRVLNDLKREAIAISGGRKALDSQ